MTMSTRIGRTVNVCTCKCIVVDAQNNMTHETVKLYGDYTIDKRIQNAVKRKLGNDRVLVESYTKEKYFASMSMEKFLKEAESVEKKEE